MSKELDFHYGGNKPSIWFDAETFGDNVLVPGFSMYSRNLDSLDTIDRFPISEAGKSALKRFYTSSENVLEGMDTAEINRVLYKTSYTTFLSQHAGLPEEVVELFIKAMDGYWGVQTHSLSTAEAMQGWLPGAHLLGDAAKQVAGLEESEAVAMFPDGNASIARLIVQSLIPAVALEAKADNIALAKFDYGQLDHPDSTIRIRLESTVVQAANKDGQVDVMYVRKGVLARLRARHCVLACYHAIIPYLCAELPESQKEALRYQVKHPMLLTNVLVRSSEALNRLGITGAYCPSRMHAKVWMIKGVNTAGYQPADHEGGVVPLMFWGMTAPPKRDIPIHDQLREARKILLGLTFEDFEREVRTVLDGLLGPAGFNVAEDILAITVNRWPHGYSYGYLDLWDPDWEPGKAPHELARQPFGNIAIANSDAAASAYTHTAIEEAFRAVATFS